MFDDDEIPELEQEEFDWRNESFYQPENDTDY